MYLAEKTDPAPNGGAPVILEGIVRKKCVVATYNRNRTEGERGGT